MLTQSDPARDSLERFVGSMPEEYRKAFQPGDFREHHAIVASRRAPRTRAAIWTRMACGTTVVCVVASDRPGLISDVSSVFAGHGVSIRGAQIYTRSLADGGAEAVDFFWVESDERKAHGDRIARCLEALEAPDVGSGAPFDVESPLVSSVPERATPRAQATITALSDERGHYLVTVESSDRIGLLHDVSQVLARHALQILSAHAATDREGLALDCFVVRHLAGQPLSAERRESLRARLVGVVS